MQVERFFLNPNPDTLTPFFTENTKKADLMKGYALSWPRITIEHNEARVL